MNSRTQIDTEAARLRPITARRKSTIWARSVSFILILFILALGPFVLAQAEGPTSSGVTGGAGTAPNAVPGAAPAAGPTAQGGAKAAKRTQINFEDQLVEGQAQKPELFYLLEKRNANFKRLIHMREDFLPEMRKSADEITNRKGTSR